MLVDFGLAVTPGHLSLGGTPGYMAPEAAAGQPVDKRSDVYSSCVVLAELLRGARLFTTASSLALTREQASRRTATRRDRGTGGRGAEHRVASPTR